MKQILCVLSILITSLTAFGQSYTNIGSPNSTTHNKGGLRVDSGGIQLPVLAAGYKQVGKGLDTNFIIFASALDSLPAYMRRGIKKKLLSVFDSGIVYVAVGEVGQPNGVASLGAGGVVPSAQLPAITISGQVFIDASQAAMLAHGSATIGALSVRTDIGSALFVLAALPSSALGNWQVTQGNGVSAFNSRTGAVNPRAGDYNTDSVTEGVNNKYYTAARVQSVIASDTGASGSIASQDQVKDTAKAIRASGLTATVAIGSTVTGAVNSNILFAKGSTLGQSSKFTYDTSTNLLKIKNAGGNLVASIGSDLTGPYSKWAIASTDGSASITGVCYLDNSNELISFVNGSNSVQIQPALGGGGGLHTQILQNQDGTIADLSDITKTSTTWVHLTTLTNSSFSVAATTTTINSSYTLPAKSVINAVVINPTTAFSGGGLTGYNISIGGTVSGVSNKYTSLASIYTGASFTAINNLFGMESFSSSSVITVFAKSSGGNLNAATQGAVDIYLLINTLP